MNTLNSPESDTKNSQVGIVGLGYVGLPLAVAFGHQLTTIGFDINARRVAELRGSLDTTNEVNSTELKAATKLSFTDQISDLGSCKVILVTVPTPIDQNRQPDLQPLLSACENIGNILRPGTVVVFESTVFPGATEEVCVPVLSKTSGLVFNKDFFVGYSPERVNPGDKQRRLNSIVKVVSGSTPQICQDLKSLYETIVDAGIHCAPSIKVAEAAKVIENTQRDLNIALVNELSKIFSLMDIDTEDVLKAAGTKWNFLPFRPGLVGGHCIGVDPYYLTHKAQFMGYYPEVILAGRRVNDTMPQHVISELVKKMLSQRIMVDGAHVLLLGITFKENCPDIRNSKAAELVKELEEYHISVDVLDPQADAKAVKNEYGIELCNEPETAKYDGIVAAVAHDEFKAWTGQQLQALCKDNHVIYDLKYMYDKDVCQLRL